MTRAEELKEAGYIVKPCEGCQKPMILGRTPEGKWIPLDPVPPVYTIIKIKDAEGSPKQSVVRTMECFVLHHVTCPQREQFRKTKP